MTVATDVQIPNDVPAPLGAYVAVALRGDLGFVSGQFPIRHGQVVSPGRVGGDIDVTEAKAAARIASLNVLGQIKKALGDDLSRVELARVDGFIAATPEFDGLPAVLDGASETFVELLGARGLHARSVIGVSHLPRGATLELAVIFRLRPPQ